LFTSFNNVNKYPRITISLIQIKHFCCLDKYRLILIIFLIIYNRAKRFLISEILKILYKILIYYIIIMFKLISVRFKTVFLILRIRGYWICTCWLIYQSYFFRNLTLSLFDILFFIFINIFHKVNCFIWSNFLTISILFLWLI
jgi:hypothetical protein